MTKKLIRLTESDLHRIVKESVNKVLTELDWKTYANAARKGYYRQWKEPENKWKRYHKFRRAAEDAFNREHGTDDVRGKVDIRGRYGSLGSYNPMGDEGSLLLTTIGKSGTKSTPWSYKGVSSAIIKPSYDAESHGVDYAKDKPIFRTGADVSDNMRVTAYGSPWKDVLDTDTQNDFDAAENEFSDYAKGNYEYQKGKGWQLKK